jgi:hypothetical protein
MPTNRSTLIRLAHSHPKGSDERVALLERLRKTSATDATIAGIRNKIAGAEREVAQAKAALTKYESDPKRYAPQLDNLKQSLRSIEVAARSGGKLLGRLS